MFGHSRRRRRGRRGPRQVVGRAAAACDHHYGYRRPCPPPCGAPGPVPAQRAACLRASLMGLFFGRASSSPDAVRVLICRRAAACPVYICKCLACAAWIKPFRMGMPTRSPSTVLPQARFSPDSKGGYRANLKSRTGPAFAVAVSRSFAGQLVNAGPGRGNPSGEPVERAEGGADATAATAVDATVGNAPRGSTATAPPALTIDDSRRCDDSHWIDPRHRKSGPWRRR
jgi:hypothetical protein